MKIDFLRRKIDTIDAKIVALIGERFSVIKRIGEAKKRDEVKVFDKKREILLIEEISSSAKRIGVGKSVIKKIYKIILKESRRLQG